MIKRILYFDMDGVVSDLIGYLHKLIKPSIDLIDPLAKGAGVNNEQKSMQQRMFKVAAERDMFWEELPVLPGSKEFYHSIKQSFDEVYILSYYQQCIPAEKPLSAVRQHKRRWFLKHIDPTFNADHIIVTDQPKEIFIKEGQFNLLIDDSWTNINKWYHKGGVGVWHQNIDASYAALAKYGIGWRCFPNTRPDVADPAHPGRDR